MRGNESKVEFFKRLPPLIYKTYQCSGLSTSESIERAFTLAKALSQRNKEGHKVALILDEIGLAEASKSNPLKVLHRLLEDKSNVPMIGLSNWSLDVSKMNRVVFVNRPTLTKDELIEAARALKVGAIKSAARDSLLGTGLRAGVRRNVS